MGKKVNETPTNITTKQYSHIEWKAVKINKEFSKFHAKYEVN